MFLPINLLAQFLHVSFVFYACFVSDHSLLVGLDNQQLVVAPIERMTEIVKKMTSQIVFLSSTTVMCARLRSFHSFAGLYFSLTHAHKHATTQFSSSRSHSCWCCVVAFLKGRYFAGRSDGG